MLTISLTTVSALSIISWAALIVSLLKGRYAFSAVAFLLFGPALLLSACCIAREDSFWAKRFYNGDKLARAEARHAGKFSFQAAFLI